MALSRDDRLWIIRHEGYSGRPYDDGEGCSVCWGHRLHDGKCTDEDDRSYTEAECEAFLEADLAWVEQCIERAVTVDLTPAQYLAIASFTYSWGCGNESGFPATSLCRAINEGRHSDVPTEMVEGRGPPTSRHPEGRPYDKGLAGVRNRRIREAEMYMTDSAICVADLFEAGALDPTTAPTPPDLRHLAASEGQGRPGPGVLDTMRAVIADLRAQGVVVHELDGWERRGRPYLFVPERTVHHHTADGSNDARWVVDLLANGRADLNGPLCQWHPQRSGALWVIAAGTSNHAGVGGWRGVTGNTRAWGLEYGHSGSEPWSREQLRTGRLLSIALWRHGGIAPEDNCDHQEWDQNASRPTGKWDRGNLPFSRDVWRDQIAEATEEDDMYDAEDRKKLDRVFAEVHDNHAFIAELKATLGDRPGADGDWRKGLAIRGPDGRGPLPPKVRVSGTLDVEGEAE